MGKGNKLTRIFNGKTFEFYDGESTKVKANKKADLLRKKGFNVRVQKLKGIYVVWARK